MSTQEESRIVAAIPVLPASDVDKAIEHYETKLGFQKVFADAEPAGYAGVARDGIMIHLCKMDDGKYIASQTMLRFRVQNVDALYEEIKSRGEIHPNGPLQTKPWGTREFGVIDRDGVCISFYEVAPSS